MRSWWWVIVIWLGSYAFYEKEMREKTVLTQQLQLQLKKLKEQKRLALKRERSLKEQIESLSDLKWIERILIEELGRVPDGGVPISFQYQFEECVS